jgi:fibronectin type 3 domain-containing protein
MIKRISLTIVALTLLIITSFVAMIRVDVADPMAAGNPQISAFGMSDAIKIANIDALSNEFTGPRSTIAKDGNNVYVVYGWVNGTNYQLTMKRSTDSGSTWSGPLDVWQGTPLAIAGTFFVKPHLEIWKGQIYVFINWINRHRSYFELFEKHTSVSQWTNLKTATVTTIMSTSEPCDDFDVASDSSYLYLAPVRASQLEGWFYRYDGSSWSTRVIVVPSGYCTRNALCVYKDLTTTKLIYIYARFWQFGAYSDGKLYMRTSTNYGSTWSSASAILGVAYDNLNVPQVLNLNGTIIVFCNRYQNDDVVMSISRNGGSTWSASKTIISSRGLDPTSPSYKTSYSTAALKDNKTVVLAYESQNGIKMIYSKDWGSNWISESNAISLFSGTVFDPILSEKPLYAGCTKLVSGVYEYHLINMNYLYLDDFKPLNPKTTGGYYNINVSWNPPGGNVFDLFKFNGYEIYRGRTPSTLTFYKNVGNVTYYKDIIKDTYDSRFYYRIRSNFDNIGVSEFSDITNGISAATDPPVITGSSVGVKRVTIDWTIGSDVAACSYGLESFTVYRGRYHDAWLPIVQLGPSIRSYTDTSVPSEPGIYYYWASYTLDFIGEVNVSAPVQCRPQNHPGPPEGLSYQQIGGGVRLIWEPPNDDGSSPITYYRVYTGLTEDDLALDGQVGGSVRSYDLTNIELGSDLFATVSAVNSVGEGARSDTLYIDYMGAPSSPTDVRAVGKSGSIVLTWSPPAVTWGLPVNGYLIYRGSGEGDIVFHIDVEGTRKSFTDYVENGIGYLYCVSARNVYGEGEPSGIVGGMASGKPGAVSGFSGSPGDKVVRLTWSDDIEEAGSPIAHINLYRSLSEVMMESRPVPDRPGSYLDGPLDNGIPYYYWVSASNRNGEGPVLGPIVIVPGRDPNVISDLVAEPHLLSVELKWTRPDFGGYIPIAYKIYRGMSRDGLSLYVTMNVDQNIAPDYVDKGLEYGRTYYYAVSSTNEKGESGLSTVVGVRPYGGPSEPIIEYTRFGKDWLTVYWSAPADDGGRPIEGYYVHYRQEGETSWEKVQVMGEMSCKIGSLAGGDHEVKVSAYNLLSEGKATVPIKAHLGTVPDAPDGVKAGYLEGKGILSWKEPSSNGYPLEAYMVYMVSETERMTRVVALGPDATSYERSGLAKGELVVYYVTAINGLGESLSSDGAQLIPLSVPGPVQEISLTVESGDVELEWYPPEDDGGSVITGYNVYRGPEEGDLSLLGEVRAGTVYKDATCDQGRTYRYSVRAVNAKGEARDGSVVEIMPSTVPGPPISFTAVASTDQIVLNWSAPGTDGGMDILGYQIYRGSGSDLKPWRTLGPDEFETVDQDVKAGTYRYRVTAYSGMGEGSGSEVEADVPGRVAGVAIIGFLSFLVPALMVIATALLVRAVRKSLKRRKEEARSRPAPTPPPTWMPSPAMGSVASKPALPVSGPGMPAAMSHLPQAPMPVKSALPAAQVDQAMAPSAPTPAPAPMRAAPPIAPTMVQAGETVYIKPENGP